LKGTKLPQPPHSSKDTFKTPIGIALFAFLSLIATACYSVALGGIHGIAQLIWAAALWSAGVFGGFLFAIPHVNQGNRSSNETSSDLNDRKAGSVLGSSTVGKNGSAKSNGLVYNFVVNTNLEQISDWLTKIIIGTTLIELKEIPEELTRLAALVGSGLPATSDHRGYAMALIMVFCISGFLFGYLTTRLYVQRVLLDVERALVLPGEILELAWRLESTQLAEQTLRTVAAHQSTDPAIASGVSELKRLSERYLDVRIPDYKARVAEKDRLADEMVRVIREGAISRELLAGEDDQGFLLGLAATSLAFPEREDLPRLLVVASKAKLLHVRYRVVLALNKLVESGFVPQEQINEVVAALTLLAQGADNALKRRIEIGMERIARNAEIA
jgi:hypothetical protein